MGAALSYTYRYPFASELDLSGEAGPSLRLATFDERAGNPYFFDGRLEQPQVVCEMLLGLTSVVRRHFWQPRPMLLDPVVTCHEAIVRFEGFSGCCGVYARVDLPAEAFSAELAGRGTTNVDFNDPMRASLARVRGNDDARLAVGADGVTFETGGAAVVEKKVKLPVRWIKGFSEVQAYQPRLEAKFEVSAAEARKFVRSLPKGGSGYQHAYVTSLGRGLRLSGRASKGAVRVHGTDRIRVLEPLLHTARGLRVWGDDDAGTSGWEVQYETGRFFLMMSPELRRGFSGEGQVLSTLAKGEWEDSLDRVQAELGWHWQIEPKSVAERTGLGASDVESALVALGTRGLAGFDVTAGAFFHRELPFDMAKVETMQPRLRGARKLADGGGVRITQHVGAGDIAQVEAFVEASQGSPHRVRLHPDGDRCTCDWYMSNEGDRGPCKHVLATRMVVDAASGADVDVEA